MFLDQSGTYRSLIKKNVEAVSSYQTDSFGCASRLYTTEATDTTQFVSYFFISGNFFFLYYIIKL